MSAYDKNKDGWPAKVYANQPARQCAAVTPDNATDLPFYAKALYVGVTGDITLVAAGDLTGEGTPVLFKAVPVGWFPVQVRRVNATGTTASQIVALYD